MPNESGAIDKMGSLLEHESNKVAMSLLRMALTLLDRDGEMLAAADVATALHRLGDVSPTLTDAEAAALLDQWEAHRHSPNYALGCVPGLLPGTDDVFRPAI